MAIIGVIWHHATNAGKALALGDSEESFAAFVTNTVAVSGWRGVHLFFILSGFVLTQSYMRLRAHGLGSSHYYRRRMARLLPLYYLALLLLACYRVGGIHTEEYMRSILFYGLFGYVLFDPSHYAYLAIPGTSLGYEVIFSIAVPLIMKIKARIGGLALFAIYMVIGYVASGGGCYTWVQGIDPSFTWSCTSIYSCSYFFWGILLHDVYMSQQEKLERLPLPAVLCLFVIGLAVALCFAGTSPHSVEQFFRSVPNGSFYKSQLFVGGLSLATLSALASRGMVRQVLANRPIQLVGMMCYSLFIWHMTFVISFQIGRSGSAIGVNIVGISVMMILCFLSYRYIEFPTRPLQDLLPVRGSAT